MDVSYHCYEPSCTLATQTRDVKPMLNRCWANVFDISPILSQHWVNISWFVGVARGCRCFRFTQLYILGSVRGWSSCTIRPIISEDILHNSVHVLNIFFYMNDKRYETLNLSIECHNLIITGQCRTGKTLTLRQLVDLTLFKWSIVTIRHSYWNGY